MMRLFNTQLRQRGSEEKRKRACECEGEIKVKKRDE